MGTAQRPLTRGSGLLFLAPLPYLLDLQAVRERAALMQPVALDLDAEGLRFVTDDVEVPAEPVLRELLMMRAPIRFVVTLKSRCSSGLYTALWIEVQEIRIKVLCYATAKLLRDEPESMVPSIDPEQVRKLAGGG